MIKKYEILITSPTFLIFIRYLAIKLIVYKQTDRLHLILQDIHHFFFKSALKTFILFYLQNISARLGVNMCYRAIQRLFLQRERILKSMIVSTIDRVIKPLFIKKKHFIFKLPSSIECLVIC